MSAHSRLAPSSAHRWLNCIGSVYLSGFLPIPESSDAAKEGTLVHAIIEELSEHMLRNGVDDLSVDETLEKFDSVFQKHVGDILVDRCHVKDCAKFYLIKIKEFSNDIVDSDCGYHHIIEKKFSISEGISGTPDLVLYNSNMIHVIDYKNGKVPVYADKNPQLMLYLMGFINNSRDYIYDMDNLKLKISIIQPNSNSLIQASHYELKPNDLYELKLQLDKARYLLNELDHIPLNQFDPDKSIRQGNRNHSVLEAGSWCKWCSAMRVCPKIHSDFKKITYNISSNFKWVPDNKELKKVLDSRPIFKEWSSEIDDLIISRSEFGEEIPDGYTIKEAYTNRKIKDENELADTLKQNYPELGDSLFEPIKLKSPNKLEQLIGKEIKPILEEHCEVFFTGYKLTKQKMRSNHEIK